MKKVIFSAAALMLASISFAGTPETKEAKPELKTEAKAEIKAVAKTNADPLVYHYTGKDAQGRIIFEQGPATNCPAGTTTPCEWESEDPMTSPQLPSYINSNAVVTKTRN